MVEDRYPEFSGDIALLHAILDPRIKECLATSAFCDLPAEVERWRDGQYLEASWRERLAALSVKNYAGDVHCPIRGLFPVDWRPERIEEAKQFASEANAEAGQEIVTIAEGEEACQAEEEAFWTSVGRGG